MDKNSADAILKKYAESIFVDPRKKADMSKPNNIAALITAATKMSHHSGKLATPDMTTTQLLDVYGVSDDKKVTDLLGMSSNYVKSNIGYSVDLEDISASKANYNAQQGTYDELYSILAMREKSYANLMERTR